MVKEKASRNRIDLVLDIHYVLHEGDQVPKVFVDHYCKFLGEVGNVKDMDVTPLFHTQLSEVTATHMIRSIMKDEVKEAMFSIGITNPRVQMITRLRFLKRLGILLAMMSI